MEKRASTEKCLGCGQEVAPGTMTCIDCIREIAPELARRMHHALITNHIERTKDVTPVTIVNAVVSILEGNSLAA